MREPKAKTLELLCSFDKRAETGSLHTAARIPLTLFALMDIPIPVPHMTMPFLTFPLSNGFSYGYSIIRIINPFFVVGP